MSNLSKAINARDTDKRTLLEDNNPLLHSILGVTETVSDNPLHMGMVYRIGRKVFNYTIYEAVIGERVENVCFSHDGPGNNDWIFSTPISGIMGYKEENTTSWFCTRSGSIYEATGYNDSDQMPDALKETMLRRYGYESLTAVSLAEWEHDAKIYGDVNT